MNCFKRLIEVAINEFRGKKYNVKEDYFRFRVGQCIKEMPVDEVLKISWAVVAFDLTCEGKNGLLVLSDLKECFWENLNGVDINGEFEIIENKK